MIAAMMTAANLGARVTGWGFVVFTAGSLSWTAVGLASGQTNLVATNAFLTFVNLVGIWRWLGRQRAYEDGGRSAKRSSRASATPTLFTATGVAGMPVVDRAGEKVGSGVEALLECTSGRVSYVVVATGGTGGIGEQLRPVPCDALEFGWDQLILAIDADAFQAIPPLAAGDWPAAAPESPAQPR
jgi:hypothetical protein